MSEETFRIELSIVREDAQEGTTTDVTVKLATVFNEEQAGRLFKLFAKKLGKEV